MAKPQISVIIPVYNSGALVDETIQSVINQTFTDWELLLIDDGSDDQSIQIVRQYAKKDSRIFLSQRNRMPKGPSTCRNLGLEMARSPFIVFLDADDLFANTALEQRLQMMKSKPDHDFMVFKAETFHNTPGDTGVISNIYPQAGSSYLHLFLYGLNPWQTQCPIWKREFLQKLEGWDEKLKRITDPDLHSRAILSEQVKFSVVKDLDPDCFYRTNHNPLTRNDDWLISSIQGRIRFFKKMFGLIEDQDSAPMKKKKRMRALATGVKDFIKGWLLSRLHLVNSEFEDLMVWMKQDKVIGRADRIKIRWVAFLWKRDGLIIRIFRLKGIFTRLIS